jgi:hypothetical protein
MVVMPTNAQLSQIVSDLSGDVMALRAAFESHREHCGTDKADTKSQLTAINGKLWAGLLLLLLQFVAITGYLVVQGPPWVANSTASIVDRGGGK